MFNTLKIFYRAGLLHPWSILCFVRALFSEGLSLMAVVRFSALRFPQQNALSDSRQSITFTQLYRSSRILASCLKDRHRISGGNKAAILCRSHLAAVQSLLALSRLGVNAYLLNSEMSAGQLSQAIDGKGFDLLIYDIEKQADVENLAVACLLPVPDGGLWADLPSVSKWLGWRRPSQIVVLTSGSTGDFKTAGRKPSPSHFINPFVALLDWAKIGSYSSVYIAAPLYHGYGLAALVVSLILGKHVFVLAKYQTEQACSLIKAHHIEVAVLVPLMLQRMLAHDRLALSSLRCVLSGGAPLGGKLALEAMDALGGILFNLYGTSEAGFSVMASPSDLRAHPETIGRAIKGVSIKIIGRNEQRVAAGQTGMLCIKSSWVMDGSAKSWIPTGDLARVSEDGCIFLQGRSDSMIVSGGENVYPEDLERILSQHEAVANAAAVGIADSEFGQRLLAFVELRPSAEIDARQLMSWLSGNAARYQMPVRIVLLDALPMLSTGKVDKKNLKSLIRNLPQNN